MGRPKIRRKLSKEEKRRRRQRRDLDFDQGDGVFASFSTTHPELAKRETRILTLPGPDSDIPAGEYLFIESFCKGRTCDCRRVMFQVFTKQPGPTGQLSARPVLIIGYGWEPLSFYRGWIGDAEMAASMKGPGIEINSPYCPYASALLELFRVTCLGSEDYVERVARHYWLFKQALGAPRPVGDGAGVLGFDGGASATS